MVVFFTRQHILFKMCDEDENVVFDEFRVCVSVFGSESIHCNSRVVMSYLEKYTEDEFTSSHQILGKRRFVSNDKVSFEI